MLATHCDYINTTIINAESGKKPALRCVNGSQFELQPKNNLVFSVLSRTEPCCDFVEFQSDKLPRPLPRTFGKVAKSGDRGLGMCWTRSHLNL